MLESHKQVRYVSWNPDNWNHNIVHVDGSSLGNPWDAGFGVVVRNSSGSWKQGILGYIGVADNIAAKLTGILHGLLCIKTLGLANVHVYSDSTEAIWILTNVPDNNHGYASIIHQIKECWDQERVHLCTSLEKKNFCGCTRATWSSRCWLLYYVGAPPDDIVSPLSNDALAWCTCVLKFSFIALFCFTTSC